MLATTQLNLCFYVTVGNSEQAFMRRIIPALSLYRKEEKKLLEVSENDSQITLLSSSILYTIQMCYFRANLFDLVTFF
jgi:hypothetical protein